MFNESEHIMSSTSHKASVNSIPFSCSSASKSPVPRCVEYGFSVTVLGRFSSPPFCLRLAGPRPFH